MNKVKLKEICRLINGRAYKQHELLESGKYPVLRVGNFFSDKEFYYSDMELDKDKYCDNGDLLFAWSASFGPKIWNGGKVIYHYHIWKMELTENVDKNYLYYYLYYLSERIKREGHGGIMIHTTKAEMEEREFVLPELLEQREIAKILANISSVIEMRKQELEKLDELIKARFLEMFGDPLLNEKGWEAVTIGDIVTEVRYGTSRPAVEGGKYPYLRMNNLTADGHLDLNDLKYIDIPDDEIEKCVVRKGDVLFNRTNSIELVGKTAVFDLSDDMVIAGYIIRVRLTEKMLPEVLAQYMNLEALKGILRGMAKGAVNQANINAQELQSIKVYIPDMKLQKQFVEMKEKIDKSKAAVQKALDEAQLLFDSLMQKYFG